MSSKQAWAAPGGAATAAGVAAAAGAPWWACLAAATLGVVAPLTVRIYGLSRRHRLALAVVREGTPADTVRALAEIVGEDDESRRPRA